MALSKASTGGTFFKPGDHTADQILVIEGKRILKDQPYTEYGTEKKGVRDIAVADVFCFRTSADLEAQEPSLVLKDAQITHAVLVSDLVANGWLEGDAGMVTIRRPKQSFVYRTDFTPEAEAAAEAWYNKREAARSEAASDLPDF